MEQESPRKRPTAASERLHKQAEQYEANAQFEVAADQYKRAANFKAEETQREAERRLQERAYLKSQLAYKQQQAQAKDAAREGLVEYSRQIREDADDRRQRVRTGVGVF